MTRTSRCFEMSELGMVVLLHVTIVAAMLASHGAPVVLPSTAPIMASLVRASAPSPTTATAPMKPRHEPPLAMRTLPRSSRQQTMSQALPMEPKPVNVLSTAEPAARSVVAASQPAPTTAEPSAPPPASVAAMHEDAAATALSTSRPTEAPPSSASDESASVAAPTTAPTQGAEPAPGAVTSVNDDHRAYLAALLQRLNRFKVYPAALRKEKIEGRVVLTFSVGADGTVTASDIKRSSGHDALDQAAARMLSRASPLPAIPKSMRRDSLTVSVPIEYSLVTDR